MIKGKGERNGRPMLIFGLRKQNRKRLGRDMPIVIWREEMGIEYDILIFGGDTEESMAKDIASPDTIIHRTERQNQ